MIYAGSNAKRKPGSRRAAPRLIPNAVMHLVLWLGVLSLFLPRPWSLLLAAPAVVIGAAYFVQKWRRAGHDMITGAQQELKR
jgi:hypothetical protein